jgi:hypothetical protein
MVEAANPIYFSLDGGGGDGLGYDVGDALSFVHHFGYVYPIQAACVAGLTASGGIKGGAIEINSQAFLGLFHDGGFESPEMGIGIVEPLSHGNQEAGKRVRGMLRLSM